MKEGNLTSEEKKLADDFANGKFLKKKDSRDFEKIAKSTKGSRINLRLQEDVLTFFQKEADKQGIPYQTLINSALFKVASGQLVESDIADLAKELSDIKNQISRIELKKEA